MILLKDLSDQAAWVRSGRSRLDVFGKTYVCIWPNVQFHMGWHDIGRVTWLRNRMMT